ncbi:hypothetical protein KXW51_007212, partial [Aspergillus fumigatus]
VAVFRVEARNACVLFERRFDHVRAAAHEDDLTVLEADHRHDQLGSPDHDRVPFRCGELDGQTDCLDVGGTDHQPPRLNAWPRHQGSTAPQQRRARSDRGDPPPLRRSDPPSNLPSALPLKGEGPEGRK